MVLLRGGGGGGGGHMKDPHLLSLSREAHVLQCVLHNRSPVPCGRTSAGRGNYRAFKSFPSKGEIWISWGRIRSFSPRRRIEFRGFPDGLNRLLPPPGTVPSRSLKIHLARATRLAFRLKGIRCAAGCELATAAREH